MADMSKYGKTEFPAQARERLQWIVDAVRANQESVGWILWMVGEKKSFAANLIEIKEEVEKLHKMDRDALLQPNGLLTDEQIKLLSD